MSIIEEYLGADPLETKNPPLELLQGTRVKGGSRRRTAEAVFCEVSELVKIYGVNRLLFYTLTFADDVRNHVRAQERWNSLRTNCLKAHWEKGVVVSERDKTGRIHFHAIAVLPASTDVRGAFDFAAFERANRIGHLDPRHRFLTSMYAKSASQELRNEWAFWQATAAQYGFGRVQVSPIKSALGCARYVAKYLTKASNSRCVDDEKARLVRFIGYREITGKKTVYAKKTCRPIVVQIWRSLRTRLSNGWAWCTKGGAIWRHKAKWAAAMIPGVTDEVKAAEILGPRWAFVLTRLGEFAPLQCLPKDLHPYELARKSRRGLRYAEILHSVETSLTDYGRSFDVLLGTPFHAF